LKIDDFRWNSIEHVAFGAKRWHVIKRKPKPPLGMKYGINQLSVMKNVGTNHSG
jgi:hypothetical protein